MNIFNIFKKGFNKNDNYKRAETMTYTPTMYYSAPAIGNVFEADVAQQAINCILKEVKKLEPRHVIKNDSGHKVINDNIQRILSNPNPLMTTADFIEKIIYNYIVNSNSFIMPTWEGNQLVGLYPLQPTNVEFLQDATNKIFVKFTFSNNYETTIRYSDVIHIRNSFTSNEFMGGNAQGTVDTKALKNAISLNNSLLNGVQKALDSSYAVNGIFRINTMLDEGKTEKAVAEFTEKLRNNENGFLTMDLKSEFIPFNKDVKLVDKDTLQYCEEKVLRFYGVSLPILSGKYTKEDYEAFFQSAIEPIIVALNQAFTKTLFSEREAFSFGHQIIFYTSKLNFMTMNEKKEIGALLSSTGAISVGELRGMFGLPPCEDEKLNHTLIMSKNYGDAKEVANQISIENNKDNIDSDKDNIDSNKDNIEDNKDE